MVHLAIPTKFHFHYAYGFVTQSLAHMLDSLVRVSRRVDGNHFVKIPNQLVNHAALKNIGQEPQQSCLPRQHLTDYIAPALRR
jgi:hypothetical protein